MRMYRNDTNNGTADVDLGNQEPGPGRNTVGRAGGRALRERRILGHVGQPTDRRRTAMWTGWTQPWTTTQLTRLPSWGGLPMSGDL